MTKKENTEVELSQSSVESTIITLRGVEVILDKDLAELYQVETKRLDRIEYKLMESDQKIEDIYSLRISLARPTERPHPEWGGRE